jgi:ring-1,2-phenylacetyl-CoA epoxidase subunit PaaD
MVTATIWQLLETVCDPEVPVLSILDLGIVRDVTEIKGQIVITITPTYSGCPAMNVIEMEIRATLFEAHFKNVLIKSVLKPAWTTDWLSENGKRKLEKYGIAPPVEASGHVGVLFGRLPAVKCPQCGSKKTEMVSLFGSTACKALYKCLDCLEPFDYFKCLK